MEQVYADELFLKRSDVESALLQRDRIQRMEENLWT